MIMQRDIKGIHSSELTMEWQLSMCRLQHHQQKGETAMCIYSVLWNKSTWKLLNATQKQDSLVLLVRFWRTCCCTPFVSTRFGTHLSDTTHVVHLWIKGYVAIPSSWWVGCFPEFKGGMELRSGSTRCIGDWCPFSFYEHLDPFLRISQTEAKRLWNTWTYTNMYAQNMASLM